MKVLPLFALLAAVLASAAVSTTDVSASQRPFCRPGTVWNMAVHRCVPRFVQRKCPPGHAMRSGRCLPICAIGIINSCNKRHRS